MGRVFFSPVFKSRIFQPIVTAGGADVLLLESGDDYLLENGDRIALE